MSHEFKCIRNPLRIGHRGAAGYAPENTLASLQRAIELGVDLVEFDVRRSADEKLVLLHDDTVDRTTDGTGRVESLPLDVLRGLDAGEGERIPLLQEALACLNGRTGAMLEIKVPGIALQVCRTVKVARFRGMMIVASFIHEELLKVRSVMANAQTLALLKSAPRHPTAFAIKANVTHAGLALNFVNAGLVQELQAKGINVFVYTVDEPEDIARMKRLGVDGIISNFPERIG